MIPLNEEKLIDYILGISDEAECKLIETQMQSSNDLRKRIAHLRDAMALPVLASIPIDPQNDLRERILNSIEDSKSIEGFIDRLTVFLDMPEHSVRELLSGMENAEHKWEQSGLPGVMKKEFKAGSRHSGRECAMIWMKPNTVFPSHSHLGDEWGFVLQGEAKEDSGRISKPGDIVYKSSDSRHSFTAVGDIPFVFFVIHNGIKFN